MSVIAPDVVCMEMQPGEARSAIIMITDLFAPSQMSITLNGGDPLMRIGGASIFETIRRRLSEEEIQELPPRPPSIRENARKNGVEERVLVRQVGPSSFSIESGQEIEVSLDFSVPPQTPEGITSSQLTVAGPDIRTVNVPIFCAVGRAVASPVADPVKIRCALAPGETMQRSAVIFSTPTAGQVIACVENGRGLIRLSQLIALKEVRRPATEEEIAELPPFPPSIREDVRRNGFVEHVEAGRSDGVTPLAVAAGQTLYANLEFSALQSGFSEIIDAALFLVSPRWKLLVVPLRLIVGSISVELLNSAVSVSQAGSVELVVTVFSQSGPGDTVHFSIDDDEDRLNLAPDTLAIQPRKSTVGKLSLFAGPNAPVGVLPATFVARVFEQLQVHRIPLRVEIQAGGLRVSTRPFSLTARQGDTVGFDVTIFNDGGSKRIAIVSGQLPAGVRMDSAAVEVGPQAGVHVQPMHLFIDRDAPTTRQAWTPITWSANNGMQSGIVNLPLTIELQPDSRTFRQDIVTPAGTALGGFAELIIRNDGHIIFRGHMHGSGFDPYAFRIGYFLRASNLSLALADTFSGRVAGTLGSGSRDCDWNIESDNSLLKEHWRAFRDGNAEFVKWYEDTGVLGTLEDLVAPLTEFILLRVLAGPATAAILVLGPELARITQLPVTSPNAIPGSIILGGVVFLFGPLAAVPTVVAGVAIAAVADVKSRAMRPSEIAEAAKVFGDTLPIDRIRVTNLQKRASGNDPGANTTTLNTVDNTIIIGMGARFNSDLAGDDVFIHELTHAWQHAHNAFNVEQIVGDIERPFLSASQEAELYRIFFDGRPWRDFKSEGQATAVQLWYRLHKNELDGEAAKSDPLFQYIAKNIRLGQA